MDAIVPGTIEVVARGKLRLYLGASPGVGKTYAMLNEGWRRKHRGTDVVVGLVESHGRPTTAAQVRDLEVVPRKKVEYRGVTLEEMDTDAIIARHPSVALIDEMAHTNAPGSKNDKRWQDIEEILDTGIDVISTLNVQHLESLNDVVEKITGVVQRETIPDAIVRACEQIELVDMTPEALRRRMAHGNIYKPDQVDAALANFFRVGNLAAIRELALLWMADRVEEGLAEYRERHAIAAPWETREHIVVAMNGRSSTDDLIRRGARIAGRVKGDLVGIYVRHGDASPQAPREDVDRQRKLLRELGGSYREVVANDIAKALVETARAENATQLVVGSKRRSRLSEMMRGSVLTSIIRETRGEIDVHVISVTGGGEPGEVADGVKPVEAPRGRARRQWAKLSPIPPRRVVAAFGTAVVVLPLLTLVLAQVRHQLGFASDLLLFLISIMLIAMVGGIAPAMCAAVAGFFLVDYYFASATRTFALNRADEISALVVFVVAAAMVSILVDMISRRAGEARRARVEAGSLASMAGSLLRFDYPLDELAARLMATFRLDGVSVLRRSLPHDGDMSAARAEWSTQASAGLRAPTSPTDADLVLELSRDSVLAIRGTGLSLDDREVLGAFAAQLALALESRRVQTELADKALLEKANELRNSLLAAVSHDLRTPLASIKTAATSLIADHSSFDRDTVTELLVTIDEETDRLNRIVGNLLDMSRLQSESFPVIYSEVGPGCETTLGDVIDRALQGCAAAQAPRGAVAVEVPDDLPPIHTDPALLERAVANLVANALAFSPPGEPVRIEAAAVPHEIDIRVIDRGPGIPVSERENVFHPFRRLADGSHATGVGLGLAVSRGFVEAVGGELTIDDTPGGGTTMSISLPVAAVESASARESHPAAAAR